MLSLTRTRTTLFFTKIREKEGLTAHKVFFPLFWSRLRANARESQRCIEEEPAALGRYRYKSRLTLCREPSRARGSFSRVLARSAYSSIVRPRCLRGFFIFAGTD